jgi:nitrate/nitrite-specific signal transduction histidine kinase
MSTIRALSALDGCTKFLRCLLAVATRRATLRLADLEAALDNMMTAFQEVD